MKSVNWPKPGYASITCSTISNIPYNLIFTTKFNDSSILTTIISCDYLNLSLVDEHVSDVTIRVITKLPNFEQSYKGKVKTDKYINRQNQSTTGNLSYVTFQRVTEIESLRHMVTKYRCKWYEILCEGKLKLRSHNTSYCLIEVVINAGLTVLQSIITWFSSSISI